MGSDVGQIFPTANLHRDHSFLYALVCEKELSHMGKNNGNPDLVCEKLLSPYILANFKFALLKVEKLDLSFPTKWFSSTFQGRFNFQGLF